MYFEYRFNFILIYIFIYFNFLYISLRDLPVPIICTSNHVATASVVESM